MRIPNTIWLNSMRSDVRFASPVTHRRRLMLGAAMVALSAVAAQAQDAANVAAGETPSAQTFQDQDEIMVTARRREESIQNVPVAITAFGANFLQQRSVDTIGDLVNYTPGFTVAEASGGAGGIIYLRGIGSTAAHPLIDQAVAINLDGVQISTGQILRATELDVAQIEVLRGPQALFFGKNSPGGVISFRTADPGNRFEGRLRAGYEFNANEHLVEGMLSGPLGGGWAARLAASLSGMDGWLKIRSVDAVTPLGTAIATDTDRSPGSNQIFLRGTLRFDDNGQFDARLKATYMRSRNKYGNGFLQQRIFCPLGSAQILPGVASPAAVAIDDCKPDGVTVGGEVSAATRARDPSLGNDPSGFRRNTQWLASLEMNYALSDVLRLTSVTGYYSVAEPQVSQYTFAPIASLVFSGNDTDIQQYSQEFRLASSFDGSLNFLAGAFYERSRKNALTGSTFSTAFIGPERTIQIGDNWSVFGQLSYKIAPELEISAGARYTKDEKDGKIFVRDARVANLSQDRVSFSDLSPEITLSYEPSDNLLVYGSYRQAFKAGGFDGGLGTGGRLQANPTQSFSYAPERVEGGEGGLRARFDSGRARVSLTAYHYKYTDLQYSAFDAATLSLRITNAASATIQGLEIDATWRPEGVPGVSLRATGGFNDTGFDRFIAGCYAGQTIERGCGLNRGANGAFTSQDLSGRSLSYAPRWSGSVGISYDTDVGGLKLGINGDAFYSSRFFASLEQSPGSMQDDYATFDIGARIGGLDDRWQIALIGKNLTNEYVLGRAVSVSLTGTNTGRAGPGVLGDLSSTISRGRQLLAQVTWNFGS